MKAVMESLIAMSTSPQQITSRELAAMVSQKREMKDLSYGQRQAAYDLAKFRGKKMVEKIPKTKASRPTDNTLRNIQAYLVITDKILLPLLAKTEVNAIPETASESDKHIYEMKVHMNQVLKTFKMTA